jgi:hypothetical protein
LERLVEDIQGRSGLWLTTAGEIAAHVRSLALVPRVFPQPVVD